MAKAIKWQIGSSESTISLAIVNRLDLRNSSAGNAGDGRFVFGLTEPTGSPRQMTVIFEYKLLTSILSLRDWSAHWHKLGNLIMGSADYNKYLQFITDKFSQRKVSGRPNQSSLGQIRTNENALSEMTWEFREFVINGTTRQLVPTTVKQTPDFGFNNQGTLTNYINNNKASILNGTHNVGADSTVKLGARSLTNGTWNAAGISDQFARFKFALSTCNGCHQSETKVNFLHITNRSAGKQSELSSFFFNSFVADGTGVIRPYMEGPSRYRNMRILLQSFGAQLPNETVRPQSTTTAPVSDGVTSPARVH